MKIVILLSVLLSLLVSQCRGDYESDGDGGLLDKNGTKKPNASSDEIHTEDDTDIVESWSYTSRDPSDITYLGIHDGTRLNEGEESDDDCAIVAIIRDFDQSHPDFEAFNGRAATTGLLETDLDADGKPVFKSSTGDGNGNGSETQITSAESFHDWYHDVDGTNHTFFVTLELTEENGEFTFDSGAFFPIPADEGFTAEFDDYPDKNFLFTTEVHMDFTYHTGQNFYFRGDDDLWIFIDGKLALDLGGLHSALEGDIDLDNLGLTDGREYKMEIFHAERHTNESNFRIDTNIECFKSEIPPVV